MALPSVLWLLWLMALRCPSVPSDRCHPHKLSWTPRYGVGTGDGAVGDRLVDFASNL
jgi:hypothetical protein